MDRGDGRPPDATWTGHINDGLSARSETRNIHRQLGWVSLALNPSYDRLTKSLMRV
jgi:hypothetical protein